MAPTLLGLAGTPIPQGLHGHSFLPLLRGESAGWRTLALFEYWQTKNWRRIPTWQAVRTEKWKYIHYPDLNDMDELFNLSSDAYEMNNVIHEPTNGPIVTEMNGKLGQLLDEIR